MTNEEYKEKQELDFENVNIPSWGHILLFVIIYFGASILHIMINTIIKMLLSEEKLADKVFLINLSNVLQVIIYIALLAAFLIVFRKHLKEIFSRFKLKSTWIWIGLGMAILYGGSIVYTQVLNKIGVVPSSANQDSITEMIDQTPLAGFLYVCLLAPIMEEIMFRFGIYRSIKNKTIAFLVTVVTFAGMHLIASLSAGTILEDLTSLPSYLIGAVGLTLVYHESKSIIASILTHITYNTIAFIAITATMNAPATTETIQNISSFFANIF